MTSSIDLNCDLGEGCPFDAELMPLITSANVACGFHAGDPATALATIQLAATHNVQVGAHPSFGVPPHDTHDDFADLDEGYQPESLWQRMMAFLFPRRERCPENSRRLRASADARGCRPHRSRHR